MWLYDMAEYREIQQEQKKAVKKAAPTTGKKGAAKQEYSDEDVDMEETQFSIKSHKDMKKVAAAKKPAAPPSKPVFGAEKQLTEAQKE